VKGAKNIQALYSQLIEFPSGSHDDMVDALVYAIRMLLVQGVSVAEVETAGDYSKMGMDPDDDDDDGFDDDDL
jgi:hypothetical protein